MQNNDFRAKQFLPFDALKGFKEALKIIELKVDNIDYVNKIINKLEIGSRVTIKYYVDFEYVETNGIVKKIENKKIYLLDSIINFEDIIDVMI